MSVNGLRTQRSFIHRSFFEESAKFSVFLHAAVISPRQCRQLTSINKPAKFFRAHKFPKLPESFSSDRFLSSQGHVGCKRDSLTCVPLSVLIFFGLLLVIQGVERNPGPNAPNSTYGEGVVVTTQNCRGLTDSLKLIALLKKAYEKPESAKIMCLQETHCINRFIVDNHFQGICVADNGERASKGTAILVPNPLTVCMSKISGNGRWALAAIKNQLDLTNNSVIVVASIYAPNCHRAALDFFDEFFDALDEFVDEVANQYDWPSIVLAGDFNLVFDPNTDSMNRQQSHSEMNLASRVQSKLEERDLVDSLCSSQFSVSSIDRFTWRRANCCSRLDYVYVSTSLISRVQAHETQWYSFGSTYDHASVTVKIGSKIEIPRGRSFPKLFKSDIVSPRSVEWIRSQLEEARLQIPNHWNPHQVHDFLKMILRSKTLEIRAMNKKFSSTKAIADKINEVLRIPTDEARSEADRLKIELLQAEEAEAEVLRLRAGIKWREQGEKSSKYFMGLLKSREASRTMQNLADDTGRIIHRLQDVLDHVRSFYVSLYKKTRGIPLGDPQDDEFFTHCPTLDPVQQQQLSSPINVEELKEALKSCTDSAPGLDGIPYSYYLAFGDIMLPSLLNSWNYALQTGQVAQSHLQACITLLPKKNKDLKLIQNWRPISLSPCDLKIITKVYAKRLSHVLPHILSESQVAYVPGRDISFNNRLIQIARNWSATQNKDYCIVSLDARKAFDSVSHEYLEQVMKAYNFPVNFIKVFKTLYANNCASVQVNGHISSPFKIERGVKQGDALSCGLFVLAMDPLIRNIAANANIRGLSIPSDDNDSIEIKVLAYADDVAIICKNRNLQPIFTEYERLSRRSGLELNADKTEIFNFINSNNVSNNISYLSNSYIINRIDSVKICGIHVSRQPEADYQRNVIESINRMENFVVAWRKRSLSLNGRMLAAKTFLLSQVVFQAQVLDIAIKEVRKIERLIYSFVNGAKSLYGPERIARIRLKANKDQGGINGIDVASFIKAIQIRQYNKSMIKHHQLRTLQSSYRGCADDLSISVVTYLRSHYRSTLATGIPDIQQSTLISGIPLNLLIAPGTRGFQYAREHGLKSLYELQRAILNNRLPRTFANVIIKQLPATIRILLRSNSIVDSRLATVVSMDPDSLIPVEQVHSTNLRRRIFSLRSPVGPVRAKDVFKQPLWDEPENWQSHLWRIKNPHLRAYRLKLLYKDIFSNERRFRFKLTDSSNCTICGQVETVTHQLFECRNAQRLWSMFNTITGKVVGSMLEVIMCTKEREIEIVKSIIIKWLIQIDRSNGKDLGTLKREIKHYFQVEACVDNKSVQFWNQCIAWIDSV